MSLNNANQNVPLATPGLYRLFFSTKWAGCEGKARSLDEIYLLDGGAQALLEVLGWNKLDQVQPGATPYLDEFINGNGDIERKQIFAVLKDEKRHAEARALRQGRRRGPTHAEREKQREFGF